MLSNEPSSSLSKHYLLNNKSLLQEVIVSGATNQDTSSETAKKEKNTSRVKMPKETTSKTKGNPLKGKDPRDP